MTDSIKVTVSSAAVTSALSAIQKSVGTAGIRSALIEIGEVLTESTKQRFVTSTAPDGSRWESNAESTLLSVMRRSIKPDSSGRRSLTTSRGNTKAGAVKSLAGKKPLIDTGELSHTIRYRVTGSGVEVGTNRSFDGYDASGLQFGTRDGRIPARPFLGLSTDDERNVLTIIANHIAPA